MCNGASASAFWRQPERRGPKSQCSERYRPLPVRFGIKPSELGRTVESVLDQGEGTILIVDDEPVVRQLLLTVLRRRGFEVLEAEGVPQALAIVASHGPRLALVLSDLNMPIHDGEYLARQLARSHPHIPVALMSAYFGPEIREDLTNVHARVSKPLDIEALADRVDQIVRGRPARDVASSLSVQPQVGPRP